MSYSSVDPSNLWAPFIAVSTRLASSLDKGETWTDSGLVVNSARDVTLALAAPNNAGVWQTEVSSLVYDPRAVVTERWKLLFQHYLQINGVPHFEHSWLGMKSGSSPAALASAIEIKLFGSYLYDTGNNTAGGGSQSPLGGAPAIQLDTAISPVLNTCLFGEPSLYANQNSLYLAVQCDHLSDGDRWIVLLKCASPCQMSSAASWAYVGTLFKKSDAATLGFSGGFAAPAIAETSGGVFLIVTPAQDPSAVYKGCRVYKFANLDTATLVGVPGPPTLIASIDTPVTPGGTFFGAGAFTGNSSSSGLLYGEIKGTFPTWEFQIFKSRMTF